MSKSQPEHQIRLSYTAGCRLFAENKVQEAYQKSEAMADLVDLQWSMIGHLQTNKVKLVARFATEFQALDNLHIAEALDRRLQHEGRPLNVLVQVNTSGEITKHGLPPDKVAAFLQALPSFSALRVRGFMTLAANSPDKTHIRHCFRRLRILRDRLCQNIPDNMTLNELSMGMSNDYEIAIEEGATIVRLGQAIYRTRSIEKERR